MSQGVPWSLGTSWHLVHWILLDGHQPQPPLFPAVAELPSCGSAAERPRHVYPFGQSLRTPKMMVFPPGYVSLFVGLLCWIWIRNLNPRYSCQEHCQESTCATHDEIQFPQFSSTELQWVTKRAITPTGDNQCRALFSD